MVWFLSGFTFFYVLENIPQPELFELPMRRHNDDDDDTKSTYKSIHTLLKGTNKNETQSVREFPLNNNL